MATNRTFTMIKPDAVSNGHIGAILNDITSAGFKIIAMKYTHLSGETAGAFYEVHKERPFYTDLVNFMSSGPIVAAILEDRKSTRLNSSHVKISYAVFCSKKKTTKIVFR